MSGQGETNPETETGAPEEAQPAQAAASNADGARHPAVFQPGDVIAGQFEVVRPVGRGGMGLVYEVRDRLSERRLALKCIHPRHVESPHAQRRFVEEVNLARKLRHPNIVAVYDVGRHGAVPYFTMEYLEGRSLWKVMKERGPMELDEALGYLIPLCEALEYAHKYMVHRDLSPGNVMVLPDGTVKLLDFGLARAADRATLTATGAALGKAHYMAPEQRLDAAHVDARADVYALGVMLFEMLTGQLPLGYQRLTDLRPDCDRRVDDLIAASLAPREHRLATAEAFRLFLAQDQGLEPGATAGSDTADRPELPKTFTGSRRHVGRLVAVTGALLLLAVAGWFASVRFASTAQSPRLKAERPPAMGERGSDAQTSLEPEELPSPGIAAPPLPYEGLSVEERATLAFSELHKRIAKGVAEAAQLYRKHPVSASDPFARTRRVAPDVTKRELKTMREELERQPDGKAVLERLEKLWREEPSAGVAVRRAVERVRERFRASPGPVSSTERQSWLEEERRKLGTRFDAEEALQDFEREVRLNSLDVRPRVRIVSVDRLVAKGKEVFTATLLYQNTGNIYGRVEMFEHTFAEGESHGGVRVLKISKEPSEVTVQYEGSQETVTVWGS